VLDAALQRWYRGDTLFEKRRRANTARRSADASERRLYQRRRNVGWEGKTFY
jgi:hypothetical protein